MSTLILTIGCQDDVQSNQINPWTEIVINLDGQMISIINNPKQSGWNRIYVPKDTMEFIQLNQAQLDSIGNYVNSIIRDHPIPEPLVAAEYSEPIKIKILHYKTIGRSTQLTTSNQIDISYARSWRDLTNDTKGLYTILSKNVRLLK